MEEKKCLLIFFFTILLSLPVFAQDQREKTFEINQNITLIGGYPANPKTGDVSNPTVNKTILSGEIATGVNAYHVITLVADKDPLDDEKCVVIESITISGGNANSNTDVTFGSRLINNASGGGILGSNCNLKLKKCLLIDNKASKSGGAFYFSEGTASIIGSTFIRDSSGTALAPVSVLNSGGGAIFNGGTLVVDDCVFDENAVSSNLVDVTTVGGGAIANFGNLCISNSNFKNNLAANAAGGAILCNKKSTTIQNCSFENNTSTYWGGAIINDVSSTGKIENCYFSANSTLTKSGGAIFHKGVQLDVINCTLYNNECKLSTYPSAGGIQNQGTANVINSTIVGNKTLSGNGAGIRSINTGTSTIANLTLINTILTSNFSNSTIKDLEASAGSIIGNKNIIGNVTITGINNGLENTIPFLAGIDNGNLFANYNNTLPLPENNGGNTMTVALSSSADNLAVSKGATGLNIPTRDQRGELRNVTPCIGAYERIISTEITSAKCIEKKFSLNLTSGMINLVEEDQVSIFSLTGTELIKSGGVVSTISIEGLRSGIYILRIAGAGNFLIQI